MNLDDVVPVKITVGTLSVLLTGLYVSNTGIMIEAIPSSFFIEVGEVVAEFLPTWDYSKLSFEDWIRNFLIIAPKELFSESELEEYQNENELYIERRLGNVMLVATAKIKVD